MFTARERGLDSLRSARDDERPGISQAPACSSHASAIARARSRFSGDSTAPSARSRPARAPAAALLGKSWRTWSRSCSTATTVRFSSRQRRISPIRSATVLESIAANGSSSSTRSASCSSSRANSTRWNWPTDSVSIGRRSKPARPTASIACCASCTSIRGGLAEGAEARPATEQHGVEHRDREGAVDFGLLRQVGDALGRALDAALDAGAQPEQRLEQRALAGAVGTDDGGHFGGRNFGRDGDARPGAGRSSPSG